jgi:hypothetical protein
VRGFFPAPRPSTSLGTSDSWLRIMTPLVPSEVEGRLLRGWNIPHPNPSPEGEGLK